ncbi:cation transporter [Microbacterium sp. P05]|uniref:cation transporter n=1 Tax=Microbacterium sp. P05 TaxID=3366948 RepID=UPI003746E1AB
MSIQPIRLGSIGDAAVADVGMCGCGGGSCGVGSAAEASTAAEPTASVDREVGVSGMTCAHCVSAVTTELGALDGVENVSVALAAGGVSRVSFRAPASIDDAAIAAAVEEAGYTLA